LPGGLHDIECSFEVVGDGGVVDLAGSLNDPAPSHAAQTVASLPRSEYLLDPAPDPVDGLVPVFEFLQRLSFIATPNADSDNARDAALGTNRIAEVAAPVCTVGEDLTGIVGQRIGACPAIIDVGGGDSDLLDQRCVSIGSDMGLEAANDRLSRVFDPARVTVSNSNRSSPRAISALRKRTKTVRSGVASVPEKPQNRRNEARSSSASASITSDRSYQTDSSKALNIASGGQAASPLALA
jgi:hypothetical protein